MKKSLWSRWLAWSGSFLIMSILIHVILIAGAMFLVVKVVQGRKEKLKFTAPPPSAAGSTEHKIKPSKKAAAVAPSISKRITSSAANVSVALPAMDMSSTSGPDVMASVMKGLGSSGLGSGAGMGAAGMASMPLTGLTSFGFRGAASGGLTGHFYDLKQTADKKPTNIQNDGYLKDPKSTAGMNGEQVWMMIFNRASNKNLNSQLTDSVLNHAKILTEFFDKDWDPEVLKRYYSPKDVLTAYQWFIPVVSPADALKAFGVEKEVQPSHFVVHYTGKVKAPRNGTFRFVGREVGVLAVRFDRRNVFANASLPLVSLRRFDFADTDKPRTYNSGYYQHGQWFSVEAGKEYPMEILLDCDAGGMTCALMIEERTPPTPYLKRKWLELYPKDPPFVRFPIFALKKGIPADAYVLPSTNIPAGVTNPKDWRPWEKIPEAAPEPLIFPGVK